MGYMLVLSIGTLVFAAKALAERFDGCKQIVVFAVVLGSYRSLATVRPESRQAWRLIVCQTGSDQLTSQAGSPSHSHRSRGPCDGNQRRLQVLRRTLRFEFFHSSLRRAIRLSRSAMRSTKNGDKDEPPLPATPQARTGEPKQPSRCPGTTALQDAKRLAEGGIRPRGGNHGKRLTRPI